MIAALLTALSYASLESRYPRAGGAAYVAERAFGMPLLSFVVGLAVACSGLTSIATQSQVFAVNLRALLELTFLPVWAIAIGFLLILTGLVLGGIRESMWVNVVCTLIEAAGLVLVIAVGIPYWGSVDLLEPSPLVRKSVAGCLFDRRQILQARRIASHRSRRRRNRRAASIGRF